MQPFLFVEEVLNNLDMDAEVTMFLCSVIVFFILMRVRDRSGYGKEKTSKRSALDSNEVATQRRARVYDETPYAQFETAFQRAFEDEDYSQALKHWDDLKHFHQSSMHLSMMIRAMRSCNKHAYFIATEVKNFCRAHPRIVNIGLINDLLEPVARRLDEAQLADLLARMIPSLNLTKDSRTYEILMTMHVANHNLAKAEEVMTEMISNKTVFTPCATVAVVNIGLQTRNFGLVLKAFKKLKQSWNARSTWAVSMFALESHKTNILKDIVELAHEAHKLCELLPAMVGMEVPDEVLNVVQAKLSLVCDVDVAMTVTVIKNSCPNIKADVIYNAVTERLKLGSKLKSSTLNALKPHCANSDISTSEGSRSDSDDDSLQAPCFAPPPGLSRMSR